MLKWPRTPVWKCEDGVTQIKDRDQAVTFESPNYYKLAINSINSRIHDRSSSWKMTLINHPVNVKGQSQKDRNYKLVKKNPHGEKHTHTRTLFPLFSFNKKMCLLILKQFLKWVKHQFDPILQTLRSIMFSLIITITKATFSTSGRLNCGKEKCWPTQQTSNNCFWAIVPYDPLLRRCAHTQKFKKDDYSGR